MKALIWFPSSLRPPSLLSFFPPSFVFPWDDLYGREIEEFIWFLYQTLGASETLMSYFISQRLWYNCLGVWHGLWDF